MAPIRIEMARRLGHNAVMMRIATALFSLSVCAVIALPAQLYAQDGDQIAKWIAELDDVAFKRREAAVAELSNAPSASSSRSRTRTSSRLI